MCSKVHRQDKFRLVLSFYAPDGCELSISLASLSAYLKKVVPNIEIFLESINTTLDSSEHTISGFAKRIDRLQPDLVGFSCMNPHWHSLDPYLNELKRLNPGLPILLGGYQAILEPDETIAHPAVDFVCVGDGEQPLEALVNRMLSNGSEKIDGIWEKKDGWIEKSAPVLFQDLSQAPYFDYSIFEKNGSLRDLGLSIFGPKGKFILPVMTGRGCPYLCSYCCNTALKGVYKDKGRYLRKYDSEFLISELSILAERYRVDYFEFWDELFLFDMKFVSKFLLLYQEKIGLPFSINSRVEMMDNEFCRVASEAGCDTIWFGIESGSESYRHHYLNRMMTNDQIISAADCAKKYGIRRLTFNMVGMPFETQQGMRETLLLNQQIQPEHFFFFGYIPLSGTPLYQLAKDNDLLLDSNDVSGNYQDGLITGNYRLNIKPSADGIGQEEFAEICKEMETFQSVNNRLHIDAESHKGSPSRATISSYPLNLFHRFRKTLTARDASSHLGFFLEPTELMAVAQRRAIDKIIEVLPVQGKILLVGLGSAALLERLSSSGHQCTVVDVSDTSMTLVRRKDINPLQVHQTRLVDFGHEEGTWDVLLLHESSYRSSLLDLFNCATRLLKPDGRLVVFDSFTRKRNELNVDVQKDENHFVTLAERFGFSLLVEEDCTRNILPNFDIILDYLENEPIDDPIMTPGFLDVVKERKKKYQSGVEGFLSLVLQREKLPIWQLREITEKDQPDVSELFKNVFGQFLSADFWQWKYGAGRGKAIGLWEKGELVAHYGGISRMIYVGGSQMMASQMMASQSCDVMVAPQVRGSLKRKGPFFQVCATFLENFVGYGTEHPLAFGFPNDRAYRLPHKLGLYTEPVTNIRELTWDGCTKKSLFYSLRLCDLTTSRDAAELDRLWCDMVADLHDLAVGMRDSTYWLHRYSNHPNYAYALYFVYNRISGKNMTAFVVKKGAQRLELLDWVGQSKYLTQLIRSVRLVAAEEGCRQVWLLASLPIVERLRATAPDEVDPKIVVPENAWTAAPGIDVLKDKLWLTGGDTDFL